jgi:Tfp pilus assembly protein PilV
MATTASIQYINSLSVIKKQKINNWNNTQNTYTQNVFIFNFKKKNMKKTKSFTMIEVLITALLISIWLLTVFEVMNYAKKINQRVAETTIANQIATEWTEIIYQIRNTNFIKYENDKQKYLETCNTWYDECIAEFKSNYDLSKCRLALDYEGCMSWESTYTSLWTWCYYITNVEWQNYLNEYFTGSECEINEPINEFAICLISWTWIPCTWWHEDWNDESKYWKYFRSIVWQGIFDMSSDTTWWSMLWAGELKWRQAQEYRFCSYVSRWSMGTWSIEICSTMTNFID